MSISREILHAEIMIVQNFNRIILFVFSIHFVFLFITLLFQFNLIKLKKKKKRFPIGDPLGDSLNIFFIDIAFWLYLYLTRIDDVFSYLVGDSNP